jgi:DNA polymerase type B, organellar and viral
MPIKDAVKRREYFRAHNQKRKAYNRASERLLPFCGIDGEGGYVTEADKEHGYQSYLLLRAGDDVLETGKNLSSDECLSFIADLPPDRIYVAYFFDYDVTMMLRDLPEFKLRRLLKRETRINPATGRAFFVDTKFQVGSTHETGDIRIDYLPHKSFSVQKWLGNGWGKPVTIHDTGTFFQMSFVRTLRIWFPEPEYANVIDSIEEGKALRNDITVMNDYERAYNRREVVMMARLMERFRDMLEECEIPLPKAWQGPGNIAASVFRKYGIPKRASRGEPEPGVHLTIATDYPAVIRAANNAYYGGRFEPPQIGEIPGPIYQYDIRSAYPAMYRTLPCLLHGKWIHRQKRASVAEHSFGLVKFRHPNPQNQHLGPFPVRRLDGSIVFPMEGEGWYTGAEIGEARANGFQLKWQDGWEYRRECSCDPFSFVPEMYRQRQEAGHPHRKVVLKLALNSMYGKLAQSIGDPVYSNPVWASLITGTVRAALYRAAVSVNGGADIVMLATDGIFTRSEIPHLPLSAELGDWEFAEHSGMLVLQSGVYITDTPVSLVKLTDAEKDKKLKEHTKTRGIPMAKLKEKETELRKIWRQYVAHETTEDPELRSRWRSISHAPQYTQISRPTFIGLRMALHRNNLQLAGTWPIEYRDVKYNWKSKRKESHIAPDGVLMTSPYSRMTHNGVAIPSTYYSRDIGKMQANAKMVTLRMMEADQPDWNM